MGPVSGILLKLARLSVMRPDTNPDTKSFTHHLYCLQDVWSNSGSELVRVANK